MVVGLQKKELPVCILRINLGDHALAKGMALIKRGAEGAGDLVVGADIADVPQPAAAVTGAAGVAESLRLKCASSGIPEIGSAGQPEGMHFTTQGKLRARLQVQGAVKVLVVHHVIEREAGVLARRGQHLEECSMGRILGLSISAAVRVASAYPRLEVLYRGLPAEFTYKRARALGQSAP